MVPPQPQSQQAASQPSETDPARDHGPSPVHQQPSRRSRLLVAEDAQCMQRLIRSLLGKMEVEADMAGNGQMACEMAQQSQAEGNPYDLILMDIHMPRMNGYDAARWLREHGWVGPIIAVTAYTTAEDCGKCVEAGCDDHLSKPITEPALHDIIARHLNGTAGVTQWTEMAGEALFMAASRRSAGRFSP